VIQALQIGDVTADKNVMVRFHAWHNRGPLLADEITVAFEHAMVIVRRA